MYSKTFLNSAPRLGSFQEPEETHLELASFDSALPGDFPFTNHKHPLALEQSLHLGEPREVKREPHAKGDAGSKGGGKKRPPPFSRFRCTLARPLAINMLLIMTPVNASQN